MVKEFVLKRKISYELWFISHSTTWLRHCAGSEWQLSRSFPCSSRFSSSVLTDIALNPAFWYGEWENKRNEEIDQRNRQLGLILSIVGSYLTSLSLLEVCFPDHSLSLRISVFPILPAPSLVFACFLLIVWYLIYRGSASFFFLAASLFCIGYFLLPCAMAFQISSCFILNHSDSECELAVELQFLQNMSDFYELIDFAQLFISTAVRPATYSISSNFLLTYLSSGFEIS